MQRLYRQLASDLAVIVAADTIAHHRHLQPLGGFGLGAEGPAGIFVAGLSRPLGGGSGQGQASGQGGRLAEQDLIELEAESVEGNGASVAAVDQQSQGFGHLSVQGRQQRSPQFYQIRQGRRLILRHQLQQPQPPAVYPQIAGNQQAPSQT